MDSRSVAQIRYHDTPPSGSSSRTGGSGTGAAGGVRGSYGKDELPETIPDRCEIVKASHVPSGDHEIGECKHDARRGTVRRWKRPRRAGCMGLASSRSSGQAGVVGRLFDKS
jgi:hypothetical protein